MCGPSGPGGLSSETPTEARALRRNVSNCSSGLANNHLAAISSCAKGAAVCMPLEQPDDCVAQLDRDRDGYHSRTDSSAGATSLLQTCDSPLECSEPAVPPSQLLLGTSAGLFLLDLKTRDIRLVGLPQCAVGHVTYHNGVAYASCPALDSGSLSSQQQQDSATAAGLYSVDLNNSRPSTQKSPFDPAPVCHQKLWHGSAQCTAVSGAAAEQGSCSTAASGSAPRIYLGTQPADVLYSDDMGASWYSTGLSNAPASKQWYHRLPPYEPCVRSISCSSVSGSGMPDSPRCSSGSVHSWGTDCSAQLQQQQQPELLVGVEVGGIHSCYPPQPASDMDCSSDDQSWSENSQGLCKDIQCLQRDPWSSKRLYAVAGSGSLPGGLYRSRGRGQKWKRLYGYRYSVGMAVSPYEKGRLLLLSADKPPEIGCSLFESLDGGRHWVNVTDDILDALLNLTNHAPGLFEHTPVSMFVPGGLVVACVTGHVFWGQAVSGGGHSSWQLLCEVPAAVNCLCLTDESVAPVNISRW